MNKFKYTHCIVLEVSLVTEEQIRESPTPL
jgi:hypothetical protein